MGKKGKSLGNEIGLIRRTLELKMFLERSHLDKPSHNQSSLVLVSDYLSNQKLKSK